MARRTVRLADAFLLLLVGLLALMLLLTASGVRSHQPTLLFWILVLLPLLMLPGCRGVAIRGSEDAPRAVATALGYREGQSLLIALLAGFSRVPALDDVTPPDAGRFALRVLTFALLRPIGLPVRGAVGGTGFDTMHR